MVFKTSINIKFDLGKSNFINRYIPTQSHTEVLNGVLNGFVNNSNNAHILIGPYGTGKSLVATVISNIVTKSSSKEEIETLINKFNVFDKQIAHQILNANKLKKKFLPIMLSGNEGRFRKILLSNIIKALKEENIDIILPGLSEKIIDIISMWKKDFPIAYSGLCNILNADNVTIEEYLGDITKQKDSAILYFEKLYPKLTNGAIFEASYNENVLEQMEYILRAAEEKSIGLFIIHDEFGRFLQGLNGERLNEAMQDLQDFAELANRVNSLKLMFITHKSLRLYFKGLNEDVAKEFQRIEKRFSQYHITNNQKTFLQIAEMIIKNNIKDIPKIKKKDFDSTVKQLKKYPLFPSVNIDDREKLIVKSMYPLHPISLFLLPELSKVFGQNERTLFTFLESDEIGGLIAHIRNSKEYYLPYKLFDYFFPNINESEVDTDISQYLFLYKKAVARVPANIQNHNLCIRLVKFISLWNLCELQKEQRLTTEFLAFAMQEEESYLEQILKLLRNNKVTRYNVIGDSWEINTGSSVDIKGKIDSLVQNIQMSNEKTTKILYDNLPKKYYFPDRYNDEKEMTRFGKVQIILDYELFEFNNKVTNFTNGDFVIYYVLPSNKSNNKKIRAIISKLGYEKNVLFAIHTIPSTEIMHEVKSCKIIEDLMLDKTIFAEDKGIKEELSLLLKESNYIINNYLDNLFNQNVNWIIKGKEIILNNVIELSDNLSEICDDLFEMSPRIVNDSFNKINISSQQKKAAITLVNNIIEYNDDEKFGITGSGPEYAIYAAIFKNNGDFYKNINSLNYDVIDYEPFKLLRKEVITLLNKNPKGNFSDLVNIFTATPFGIRRSLIPILLVAVLRDRWNEFMLYRNEMFVPGLNGDKLYEILYEEGSENYQYVYEKIDENYLEFFKIVKENFSSHIEDRLLGRSRILITSATLLKWLRSLPRITQVSEQVHEKFNWFRDIIKRTEVSPQESIGELCKKFNLQNESELLFLKEYGEGFTDNFRKRLSKDILTTIKMNTFTDIISWANNLHEYIRKNNKFVKTIINAENEDFTDLLAEKYFGVPLNSWSDATYESFIKQLDMDYKEAINFEVIDKSNDFIELNIGTRKKIISKVDFSPKTNTVYTNIQRIINQAGRNISPKEMEYMIYLLLDKYIE